MGSDEEYFNGLSDEDRFQYLFQEKTKLKRKVTWLNIRVICAYLVIFIIFNTLFGAFMELLFEVVKWHPIPYDEAVQFNYSLYLQNGFIMGDEYYLNKTTAG